MIPADCDFSEACGVLITLDSLRLDSALAAWTPNLDNWCGPLVSARTAAAYTPAAHTAFFLGHLPFAPKESGFYRDQLWRIATGPVRDGGKGAGMLFQGNNVIEGYRQRGFHTVGVGGVSQFSEGSYLRTSFPWSRFFYFGANLNDEPLAEREHRTFPLNHQDEILSELQQAERGKWFLFLNSPETHYPYDWGMGIPDEVQRAFPTLYKCLNKRSYRASNADLSAVEAVAPILKQMQIHAMEELDRKLGELFFRLKEMAGERSVYVVVCADHGENFGEECEDQPVWGHFHASPECLRVPLWMGVL